MMNISKEKIIKAIGISSIVFIALSIILYKVNGLGYCIAANVSDSLPGSVYIAKHEKVSGLKKGDLVMFRLPVEVPKTYVFQKGDYFMKQVACMPGQKILMDEMKSGYLFTCDKTVMAVSYKHDKYNNLLPVPDLNNTIIPDGSYFVTTPHPKSFDSRYYGLIKKEDFIGRAKLVF